MIFSVPGECSPVYGPVCDGIVELNFDFDIRGSDSFNEAPPPPAVFVFEIECCGVKDRSHHVSNLDFARWVE